MSHIVQIRSQVIDVVAAKPPANAWAGRAGPGNCPAVQWHGYRLDGAISGLELSGRVRPGRRRSPVRQLRRPLGRSERVGSLPSNLRRREGQIEARKRGHPVTEQQLADGSVKLTIQVAGGAA